MVETKELYDMRPVVVILFSTLLLLGCGVENTQGEPGVAVAKSETTGTTPTIPEGWKGASPEERAKLFDIILFSKCLIGKSKNEVKELLGAPDSLDDFGEFVYKLGKADFEGQVYEKNTTICFDDGETVVRVTFRE